MQIIYYRNGKYFKRSFKFERIALFWLAENDRFIEVFELSSLKNENEYYKGAIPK